MTQLTGVSSMNRCENLMQRVLNGKRVMIDGATGTKVESHGLSVGQIGPSAALQRFPDVPHRASHCA